MAFPQQLRHSVLHRCERASREAQKDRIRLAGFAALVISASVNEEEADVGPSSSCVCLGAQPPKVEREYFKSLLVHKTTSTTTVQGLPGKRSRHTELLRHSSHSRFQRVFRKEGGSPLSNNVQENRRPGLPHKRSHDLQAGPFTIMYQILNQCSHRVHTA